MQERVGGEAERLIDAHILLRSLVGETLLTITGRPNTVLDVNASQAVVGTGRSPDGKPVEVAWLQDVLDRIGEGEVVAIDPSSVGFRSAFLGTVLLILSMVVVTHEASPPTARHRRPMSCGRTSSTSSSFASLRGSEFLTSWVGRNTSVNRGPQYAGNIGPPSDRPASPRQWGRCCCPNAIPVRG